MKNLTYLIILYMSTGLFAEICSFVLFKSCSLTELSKKMTVLTVILIL